MKTNTAFFIFFPSPLKEILEFLGTSDRRLHGIKNTIWVRGNGVVARFVKLILRFNFSQIVHSFDNNYTRNGFIKRNPSKTNIIIFFSDVVVAYPLARARAR